MEPAQQPGAGAAAPQTADSPASGSVGPIPPPPAVQGRAPAARGERRRRFRQFLVVSTAVMALLCLGGLGTALLLYDRATKPDLSTPALVTREYLSAFLVNRDDVRAAQFE